MAEYVITRKGDPTYIRIIPTRLGAELMLRNQLIEDAKKGADFKYKIQEVAYED